MGASILSECSERLRMPSTKHLMTAIKVCGLQALFNLYLVRRRIFPNSWITNGGWRNFLRNVRPSPASASIMRIPCRVK